jgi:hypothetical protein
MKPEPTSLTPDRPVLAIRMADGASMMLLAIAIWMVLVARPPGVFGALREVFSPSSLIYIAVCVQIVRHLMWPRPSAFARLGELRVAIAARPHLAAALRAFFMTRPAVFIVAMVAVVTIGLTSTPGFVLSRDPIANLPARFDAAAWRDCARGVHGTTRSSVSGTSRSSRRPAADAAGRAVSHA